MCYTHTMEYYSAFKGQEILTSATTWVKLGAKQNNPVTKGQIIHKRQIQKIIFNLAVQYFEKYSCIAQQLACGAGI